MNQDELNALTLEERKALRTLLDSHERMMATINIRWATDHETAIERINENIRRDWNEGRQLSRLRGIQF
jgi:hypothetical protein